MMEQFFTKEVVEEIKKSKDKLLNVIMRDFPEMKRQEEKTMKATYNGMTGELIKLERKKLYPANCSQDVKTMMDDSGFPHVYDLTIYDAEKKAIVSFENVKLSDVRFSGAEVSFNG